MQDNEVHPAPVIDFTPRPAPVEYQPSEKFLREREAFERLLPELRKTHLGKVVAIHEGQVVETGTDVPTVSLRAHQRFGYIPIFIGEVYEGTPHVWRIRSPRELRS